MRTIQLHPLSLLTGSALALLAFVVMGQKVMPASPETLRVAVVSPIEVEPHPRDYVRIAGGIPYVVPQGKVLVLTAVGAEKFIGSPCMFVWIDGNQELGVSADVPEGGAASIKPIPLGLAASENSVVEIRYGTGGNSTSVGFPRAWGYLADA
jgi:hypothetical protein